MFSQVESVANKYLFQEIKNNILSNKADKSYVDEKFTELLNMINELK